MEFSLGTDQNLLEFFASCDDPKIPLFYKGPEPLGRGLNERSKLSDGDDAKRVRFPPARRFPCATERASRPVEPVPS